jgi:hypothetical protein
MHLKIVSLTLGVQSSVSGADQTKYSTSNLQALELYTASDFNDILNQGWPTCGPRATYVQPLVT